ncbi:MAG: DUF2269 family protein [Chloroflexi bacterium CFX7]|nr:DUF2269 family protein [Chloroflexi bacterium CFX7]RIL04366.1 MAG: hypothetical protein DCC78_01965 [bacterium]
MVAALALSAAALAFGEWGADLGLSELNVYKVLRLVHVVVAVVAFGSTFGIPVLMPLAGRGGVATLRVALHFAEQLEEKIVVPGSLLVAATGGGLILSDVSGYQDDLPAWIVVSIALWVAAAVIAFTVQNPAVKRALAVLEGAADNGPVPQAMGPIAGRLDRVGKVLALLAILSLFLMTWRPGLW